MRLNYVLVDHENVTEVDLLRLKREDTRVIVFLGSNQTKIKTDLAIQMHALGDRAEYVQVCGSGSNALDFHIAFTVGARSQDPDPSYFHIVSKDAGFDPLIAYLRKRKILAARYNSIADIPLLEHAKPQTPSERADHFIEKLSQPKATRPRSLKTLANAIRTAFGGQLSEAATQEVIGVLCSRGFLDLTNDKVSYPPDAAKVSHRAEHRTPST